MEKLVQPVVLAGGSGTRLWPISTEKRPKHLLEIVGTGSMFEQTLARVGDPEQFLPPIVVGSTSQSEEIGRLAPGARLILEPCARGSAAAIALAALATDPDAVLLVLPSDHHITDPAPLFEAIAKGGPIAEEGRLITFGITPSHAETGFGYIAAGHSIADGVFEARSFIEKPAKTLAEELMASGTAFWNSGMFMFQAGALLRELSRHAPDILEASKAAMESAVTEGTRVTPDRSAFEVCRNTSIDYAVMEASDRIAVVPIQLDWSDVGSWAAVYEMEEKDADGNVLDGRSHSLGSRHCLVRSTGPRIVTIGAESLIVIATDDHVLVAPLSEAQRVREAAELFKLGR
jgi:mannose-1-phosphate guanylyltransferase